MNIKITTGKENKLNLGTHKFSKTVDGDKASYEFDVDDDNKEATVKMLSDALDVKFHSEKDCMTNLYSKLEDSDDDTKRSYNDLMNKLKDNGL